jgi:ribosomal protein S18 acetylase RimI-like enzyme
MPASAILDGAVIGFVDAGFSPNTDEATYLAPGLDVYEEELVVTEALRNLGIGKSLMAAVEGWANEAGARMVTLCTHVTNSAARRLLRLDQVPRDRCDARQEPLARTCDPLGS